MAYKVKFTPRANFELTEATAHYKKARPNLARLFLAEVKTILRDIQSDPFHYREIEKGLRQVPIKKFPFVITYEINSEIIVIHSIFHTSRNPNQKPL
ncbi:MAG TPA: type II toxin-antitoxin system RelE/ParE family toxin [Leeuwenhoekiella sp.]|nr:type II toxin-antitoxin system RelE/ParE family toxin [Leeuwenhoekiella sp.]